MNISSSQTCIGSVYCRKFPAPVMHKYAMINPDRPPAYVNFYLNGRLITQLQEVNREIACPVHPFTRKEDELYHINQESPTISCNFTPTCKRKCISIAHYCEHLHQHTGKKHLSCAYGECRDHFRLYTRMRSLKLHFEEKHCHAPTETCPECSKVILTRYKRQHARAHQKKREREQEQARLAAAAKWRGYVFNNRLLTECSAVQLPPQNIGSVLQVINDLMPEY